MTRRTFFRRTVGALATAAIAPRLLGVFEPTWYGGAVYHISAAGIYRNGELVTHEIRALDDVWCERCHGWQLPDHISADGLAWHAADGGVFVSVTTGPVGHLWVQPWPGGPPSRA